MKTVSFPFSVNFSVKRIITEIYLQRFCIFGRDGCNRSEDELRCIVALNKLHTPVSTVKKPLTLNKDFTLSQANRKKHI